MSSRTTTFFLAAAMSMAAGVTAATAAPNKSFGTCDTATERAICAEVALCERSGGQPRRPFFSTSLSCCIGDHCAPMSELTQKVSFGSAGERQ